ncbi:MAG TPA: TonB-dependent receptor plug domain-containing protein [Kofleriaceae bacterium]
MKRAALVLVAAAGTAHAQAAPDDVPVDDAGEETIVVHDIQPSAPGQTKVDAETARQMPGGGDAAKIVQSLPGVARPPAGSADIVVWGAASNETRVFVDGVPVPALYHLGGYRAAVGNDLVDSIRLTPAAFGPDRGRAIGGVVDIGLGDPAEAPAWRAQVDTLDASVAGRGNLGHFDIAAAARKSWLDRSVDLVADPHDLAPNAPLPRWSDAQIVARGPLSESTTLKAWIIGSTDALDRTLESDDPATQTNEAVDNKWIRGQVTLRHDTDTGYSSATLWAGRDHTSDAFMFGAAPASHDTRAWVGGIRAEQQTRIADPITLTIGADVDTEFATLRRAGSLSIPAREGDIQIFGQPPGDDVSADRWSATTIDAAGHATVDLRWEKLTASVGGRLDAWVLGASRLLPRIGTTPATASQSIIYTLDPRGSLQYSLTDLALLRIDAGRYHQARDAADTSAVFGTPTLGVENAWHITAGTQLRASPTVPFAIEVALYARWLDDLVARDPSVTPPLAASLTQDGTGSVYGAQVTARLVDFHHITSWLTYSLGTSTRTDAPGTPSRPFDHDQRHQILAIAQYTHRAWSFGARVRFATGEPRTGVVGAFYDTRTARFEPIVGEHNATRLPAFFAADLRAERRFHLGSVAAAVYVEAQNITARANAEELIYSADYSRTGYLTSLPFVGLVGLRVQQ